MNYFKTLIATLLMAALSNCQLYAATSYKTSTEKASPEVFLSNSRIEAITGEKLSLKERIALSLLRKKIKRTQSKYEALTQKALSAGCATIYLKNGDTIAARIKSISPDEVKYTKCDATEEIEYIVYTADIESIKDEAGKEIFTKFKRKLDDLSIWAFVLGVVSVFSGFFGLILGPIAIILGIVSLGQIRQSRRKLKGRGFAIWAIIAGLAGLAIGIVALLSALFTSSFLILFV